MIVCIIFVIVVGSIITILMGKPKTNSESLNISKSVKQFDIVGSCYRGLSYSDGGRFVGYAECEHNPHDRYAVAIYNGKNKHIGYIPRSNRFISNSLNELNGGMVHAWGKLTMIGDTIYGDVFIPVGYNDEEQVLIKKILNCIEYINTYNTKDILSTEKYFDLLDNHTFIIENSNMLNITDFINYKFQKWLIPNLMKHLLNTCDDESIIRLSTNYSKLIELLNENVQKTILNKINKIKKVSNII